MTVWTTPERLALRETVRGFVNQEILPHLTQWERDGEIPRELHRKAGALGLLGASAPESAGGEGGDAVDSIVICEEMHHAGASGGLFASLFTCGIAVPHLIAAGDEAQIEKWVKPTLRGERYPLGDKCLGDLREAAVLCTDQILHRNPGVDKGEFRGIGCAPAHLLEFARDGESRCALLDHEQ